MKKQVLIAGLIAGISLCSFKTMPDGKDTITPKVGPFESIVVECALVADVTVQEGAQPGITLTGDPEALEHIKTRVSGKKLHIDFEGSFRVGGRHHSDIKANISMPALSGVEITGSAIVNVHGNLKNDVLNTRVSGSGMIIMDNLSVRDFSADQSGSGTIEAIAGTIASAHLVNTGSGSVNMMDVTVTDATANNTGSGGISVNAVHKLNATETGSGSIRFKGHPEDFTQNVTGSGSIKRVN